MTIQNRTMVGKKGEILPKKQLRDISGIKPGDDVLIEARPGELIIKKIYSIDELFDMPIISKGTAKEIEEELDEETKEQEKMAD